MAFQMVDADDGNIAHGGNGLGRHDADQHAADQPRPGRHGNGGKVIERDARRVQRFFHHMVDVVQMRAGGNFGHNAAIGFMLLLAEDEIGQNLPPARHDGDGGLITAGFNPQHDVCSGGRHADADPFFLLIPVYRKQDFDSKVCFYT